jgi:predicted nuclease with TOPRIM domain
LHNLLKKLFNLLKELFNLLKELSNLLKELSNLLEELSNLLEELSNLLKGLSNLLKELHHLLKSYPNLLKETQQPPQPTTYHQERGPVLQHPEGESIQTSPQTFKNHNPRQKAVRSFIEPFSVALKSLDSLIQEMILSLDLLFLFYQEKRKSRSGGELEKKAGHLLKELHYLHIFPLPKERGYR